MYIAVICPNLLVGGAEKMTVNLVNELINLGHKVDLILLRNEGYFNDEISNECNLVVLNKRRSRFAIISLYLYLIRSKTEVLISTLRETSILSGLVSKLPFIKQKIVIREASQFVKVSFLYDYLLRLAYKSSDLFIANSSFTKKSFENEIFNSFKEKIKTVVIGNPIIDKNFEKKLEEDIHHDWLDNKKFKTLISCGRLHPVKRFELLIKAFKFLYDSDMSFRLIIIGEGKELKNLKKLYNSLGLNSVMEIIEFDKTPSRLFKKANLFVSCSRTEGFSNVLVEALGSGVKVLASNSGGPSDILQNGKYGKLVEIEDEYTLAKEIKIALNDSQNIEENKKRAFSYSSSFITSKYIENISSIL